MHHDPSHDARMERRESMILAIVVAFALFSVVAVVSVFYFGWCA